MSTRRSKTAPVRRLCSKGPKFGKRVVPVVRIGDGSNIKFATAEPWLVDRRRRSSETDPAKHRGDQQQHDRDHATNSHIVFPSVHKKQSVSVVRSSGHVQAHCNVYTASFVHKGARNQGLQDGDEHDITMAKGYTDQYQVPKVLKPTFGKQVRALSTAGAALTQDSEVPKTNSGLQHYLG